MADEDDRVANMFDDQSDEEDYEGDYYSRNRKYRSDDDDDDDEEEEEEEEEELPQHKPKKARKKRPRTHNFLDIEASVETDEEEEDEDDEALGDFIADDAELAAAEKDAAQRHRRADRPAVFRDDNEALDADAIEQELRERYSGYATSGAPARGAAGAGGDWIPHRLAMPGISDPHLWVCPCLQGKERDILLAIGRNVFRWTASGKFPGVYSAFSRDGVSGHVYVEARSLTDARAVLDGIPGVYAAKAALVPLEDMVDVVKIRAKPAKVSPGAWVRVRRGNYAGDLGQVVALIDGSDTVEVRLVPRIDYKSGTSKKSRAPQRLFSLDEARRSDSRGLAVRGGEVTWRGERFIEGYVHKDLRIAALHVDGISPTLEEIAKFAAGDAEGENAEDEQAAVAALVSKAAAAAARIGLDEADGLKARDLQPGDRVEVIDGDLAGVAGTVKSVEGDDTVRVSPDIKSLSSTMSFSARQLRKKFNPGDHVAVLRGRYRGATGMVVDASAGAVVTVYADGTKTEMSVLSKDLRMAGSVSATDMMEPKAAASASAANPRGMDVHDLVYVNGGVGVILASTADSLTIIDGRGATRSVAARSVRTVRGAADRTAVDSTGNAIRIGDAVREVNGQRKAGAVLQLTRSVAFVLQRDRAGASTDSVFVAPVRALEATGSANRRAALDPYGTRTTRGRGPSNGRGGAASRGGAALNRFRGRDPLVGKTVVATRGSYKGYMGIAKSAVGATIRVELHTNARVVNIDREYLAVRLQNGDTIPAAEFTDDSARGTRMSSAAPATPSAAMGGGGADLWGAQSPAPAAGAGSPGGFGGGWDAAPAAASPSGGGWGAPAESGGGGWDAASPAPSSSANAGGSWGTPGPLTPGNFPSTPGLSNGGGDIATDGGFFSWAIPRAVVVLASSGQRGILKELATERQQAIVELDAGGTKVIDRHTVGRDNPRPAQPEKRDRVIVIRGSRRGATGTMMGKDGPDALFQPDGDTSWQPEPLRNLAIYQETSGGWGSGGGGSGW